MYKKHWTITKDHIEGTEAEIDCPSSHTIPFKLYDDDDELYFEGKMSLHLHNEGERIFEPLDWAMANYGCTDLMVKGPNDSTYQHV
jgi:hypothetical protein